MCKSLREAKLTLAFLKQLKEFATNQTRSSEDEGKPKIEWKIEDSENDDPCLYTDPITGVSELTLEEYLPGDSLKSPFTSIFML